MYTAFYGLDEKPFALSPDPRFLYLSESHREALAHLLYGIEQGEGFIAITGEVGTGKTTLCRTLLQRLGPETEVAFIFNPQLEAHELIEAINTELGLDVAGRGRRELVEQLNRFLLRKRSEGRRVLLIIDEAQNLTLETLEQIRLLSNLETETTKLIQILLLGQPELDVKLDLPELRQLKQRITVRWRLEPLSSSETRDYIRHRLRIAAGAERDLFTAAAAREIHRRARGIPRLVNVLCDRALLAGYASQAREIGMALVAEVDREVRGPRRASRFADALSRRTWATGALLAGSAAAGLAALLWIGGELVSPAPSAAPAASPPRAGGTQPEARVAAGRTAPAERPRTPDAAVAARGSDARPPPAPRTVGDARRAGPSGRTPDAPSDGAAGPPAAPATAERPAARAVAARASTSPPARAAPPAPVDVGDVVEQLSAHTPAATASWAVDGVLEAWGIPPEALDARSVRQALEVLRDRRLSLARIHSDDLALLRALNHPAIVPIRMPGGAPRYVAVGSMDTDDVTLVGMPPGAPVTLRAEQLAERAVGDVYVIWRDFEDLPDVLGPWNQGEPVRWLQRALHALGHYPFDPSGEFDDATIRAVRAFQESRRLEVDGTVGPLTKMALYGSMSDYAVPRLQSPGDLG